MKANFKIFLLVLLLPLSTYAKHGDSEFKRTIVKEINVGNGATCKVVNKYGKIIIHTWTKSQIKATMVITGYGKSIDEAQNIANLVDLDVDNDDGKVQFRTHYNPSNSGNKWFSFGKRDSKEYVNIDYEIYVPEKLGNLFLDNNFGDVLTDEISFPATMVLNYCTYDIEEASKLTLSMNYCDKGRIGKVGELRVDANYSNIKSDEIGLLVAKSNYSQYTIGKVNSVEANGNYDDYIIARVGAIKVQCNYTDFHITELQTSLNGRLVYGDFQAKTILGGFKGGALNLSYAGVKLGLPGSVPLQIKLDLNNGDVHTGDLVLKNIVSIKKNSQLNYSAVTTSGSEQSPMIDVHGVYSDVHFTNK